MKTETIPEVEQVEEGERPSAPEGRWERVPLPIAVAAAPMLGLLAVALPVIGVGMAAWMVGRALMAGAPAVALELAATVVPPFTPGEAHLAGAPAEGAPAADFDNYWA